MTSLDRQDNNIDFATLFVNPGRWMATKQQEDAHEFGG